MICKPCQNLLLAYSGEEKSFSWGSGGDDDSGRRLEGGGIQPERPHASESSPLYAPSLFSVRVPPPALPMAKHYTIKLLFVWKKPRHPIAIIYGTKYFNVFFLRRSERTGKRYFPLILNNNILKTTVLRAYKELQIPFFGFLYAMVAASASL